MGKDKKEVKFRLVNRASDDPNKKGDDDMVFQLIEDPKMEKDKQYQKQKQKILSQFDKKDLGIYDTTLMPKKQISRSLIPPDVLKKMEPAQQLIEKEKKRKFSESSCEDVSDGDSWGEEEEISLKEKILLINEIDSKKFIFSDEILDMKKYDENGIIIDGYDYYQHIAKDNPEGEVRAVLTAQYKRPPQLKPDIDYYPDGKNLEQAEVFECLQVDGDGFDELDDDFIAQMTSGKEIIKEKSFQQIQQEKDKEILEKQQKIQKTKEKQVQNCIKNDPKLEKELEQVLEEEYKDKQVEVNNLDSKEFLSIMDDHIKNMKKPDQEKTKKNDQSEDSYHSSDECSEYQSNEELESDWEEKWREEKKTVIKGVEYNLIKKVLLSNSKQFHERVNYEKDYALHEQMKQYEEYSYDSEEVEQEYTIVHEETETIASKSKNASIINRKLNIVKEEKKVNLEIIKQILETKEEIEEVENIDVFRKREKNATSSEKKQRKLDIKQFKIDRKEKKQLFKNSLKSAKTQQKKIENLDNVKPGLSVYHL